MFFIEANPLPACGSSADCLKLMSHQCHEIAPKIVNSDGIFNSQLTLFDTLFNAFKQAQVFTDEDCAAKSLRR
jgi:hypothetical protein